MPAWPNRSADWYLSGLAHADSRIRRQSVAALAVLREERAVEPLINLLGSDPELLVLAQAATALGALGDHSSVPALIGALHDAEASVRNNAVISLSKLRDRVAIEPLIEALRDSDWGVSYHAASGLGMLGDERRYGRSWTC